jgi:hypothetical protein
MSRDLHIGYSSRIQEAGNSVYRPELTSRRKSYGQEGSQKAQIFAELGQRRQKRNAPQQKGHRKKRPWWQGRKGQKPQASDSHWPFEGPQEGKEGPEKTDDNTQILSNSFREGASNPRLPPFNQYLNLQRTQTMGLAAYEIIGDDAEWRVRHDGKAENSYETKEAAFEAAVAAASLALRQGHEIRVTAPARGLASGSTTGNP